MHRRRPQRGMSLVPGARATLPLLLLGTAALAAAQEPDADPWETIEPGGNTACATGGPYRFHVRRGDPERLMLFFNGGGACWSGATCDTRGKAPADLSYRPAASRDWGNDPRTYGGAFALDNPENPFREWSQVFVSYCSGDVHLGNRSTDYTDAAGETLTIEHRGMANAMAALEYSFAAFPGPGRVMVSGASAGAISAPMFAAVVAQAYPQAEVIHFSGGGAGYRMPPPQTLWENWGVLNAMPAAIDASAYRPETLGLQDFYYLGAHAAPRLRFHQFDHAYDAVQEQFHAMLGYPTELLPGLEANRRDLREALPYLRSYTAKGEFHTLLRFDELYRHSSGGVRAVDWVRAIASGETVDNVHCGDTCR